MTDANLEDPNGEKPEGEEPRLGYKVIAPEPKNHDDELAQEALLYPFRAEMETKAQEAAAEPPIQRPTFRAVWGERIRKFAESPMRVYAASGVGIGVLLGIVLVVVFWSMGSPDGRYDLGWVTSDASGLKGHLLVEWDKQLDYRLRIEPSDANRQAGFALTVAHSPSPLSVQIHLLNSEGFVLCSREIVLNYDAREAVGAAANHAGSGAGRAEENTPSNAQLTQASDALAAAQEAERELGKDVFQNQIGADGEIEAVYAQGSIPCSAKAYEHAVGWSFSTDFPSLAGQDELLALQKEAWAKAARLSAEAHRRKAPKSAIKLLPFSIEGDDAIVAFDPTHGVIQTRGEKTFFFNKTIANADPAWQDYPVSIHYKCDRSSSCTLMHAGLGAMRARLIR
jgi:hypothetical protein